MKVCVFGLWHLGSVTAGCLAAMGVETVGLDPSAENIADLAKGVPPLHEPGLPDLLQQGIRTGKLRFTDDVAAAVSDADIVWVAFDTPVDDDDNADVAYVQRQIERTFPHLKSGAGVLVSSQMPVGSVAALEKTFAKVADGRSVEFASSPENLRLGRAIEIFRNPGRIIAGVRGEEGRCRLEPLLASICGNLTWVRVESAEMTKHALNSFLAVCITFANEVATVCERVGADAGEVELSIRSDPRVGMQSYVTPGAAFAGGTLARDVRFLEGLARREGMTLPMLGGVAPSNAAHRHWAFRRLEALLGGVKGRRIALLGLSYKPGTDAIRRSVAIEVCRLLVKAGAAVAAYDPTVKKLPDDLAGTVTLAPSAQDAIKNADAVVLATEWLEFCDPGIIQALKSAARPLLLDQSRFLIKNIPRDGSIEYVTVGGAA